MTVVQNPQEAHKPLPQRLLQVLQQAFQNKTGKISLSRGKDRSEQSFAYYVPDGAAS